MPGKNQTYGKDYKTIGLVLTPEEHRQYKIKAAETGVGISDVCRLALADDAMWKKAQREKAREKAAKYGVEVKR